MRRIISVIIEVNLESPDSSTPRLHLYLAPLRRIFSANVARIDENGKPIRGTGKMIFNLFEWKRDNSREYPKIHPTQKPVNLLKQLIEIFTDEGDVVIDPCAGSGTTLRAAAELGRNAYGFEIDRRFYNEAKEKMLILPDKKQLSLFEENTYGT